MSETISTNQTNDQKMRTLHPSLRGQRVVIVGGNSGTGYAAAECALAEGAQVTIASSDGANVEAALARLGESASGGVVNVREEASVARFFGELADFDHLIYAAGDWGPPLLSVAITRMDFRSAGEALNVNFWGALMAIKHAQAHLSSSGSITLTDKILAHKAQKGTVPSTVFEHMIRGLAVDLAPVRVNAVCPGFTLSDELANPELIREQTQHLLIPRGGDPAEMAQAYLYLMRGGYTTGQVLVVDGGLMLV